MSLLYIDTSDSKIIHIELKTKNSNFERKCMRQKAKADATLILIDKLLYEAGIQISDIKKIYVNRGPGSFTGLRVGVSVANALSFALNIPVNDKKNGEIEEPLYS